MSTEDKRMLVAAATEMCKWQKDFRVLLPGENMDSYKNAG